MSDKTNLQSAKAAKNDEFYTIKNDIEDEVQHYIEHFKGKTVYCPCDNPNKSNFYVYFKDNFTKLGLKKLIASYYDITDSEVPFAIVMNSEDDTCIKTLYPDANYPTGDFRSDSCKELMKEADIVVTNPPFSLFRELVAQIISMGKQFLLIGSENSITYKDIFKYIKDNQLWLGYNHVKLFEVPCTEITNKNQVFDDITGKIYQKFGNICWFTNIEHEKRNEFIPLSAKYDPEKHIKYDNYNGLNVDKVKDYPIDYDGVCGVPISFLSKYNPNQFEIIKFRKGDDDKDLAINGKYPYFRILVKLKK